ncbi:MAG: hypothetical protein V1682_06230 [Candidatus Omnitrophota bacterium]
MQHIIASVCQIEECKKLILDGDVTSLRMAFVLLDNAIEILMYRRIKSTLSFNEYWIRADEASKAYMPKEEYEKWRKDKKIVTPKRVKLLDKFFDEKTKFLSEDRSYMTKGMASTLRSLHKYRNEIYHNDSVRRDTIKASTILLFEIACDLLVKLHPGSTSYYSSKPDCNDRKVFFDRYKTASNQNGMLKDRGLSIIKKSLRKGISIGIDDLRIALQRTMYDRINESIENIDFIMRDGWRFKTRQKTLKMIQLVHSGTLIGPVDYKKPLKEFNAKFTMNNILLWKRQVKNLSRAKTSIRLFKDFAEIEAGFEELESILTDAAVGLDREIQHQIDMARGK